MMDPSEALLAIELGLCPHCHEEAQSSSVGPKTRCRACGARYEVTPYGGYIDVSREHTVAVEPPSRTSLVEIRLVKKPRLPREPKE